MALSVTQPLLKEHAKVREILGELKANATRFDLPAIRKNARDLRELLSGHALKEEAVLFLIGMKFLRADNQKLPELIKEHHKTEGRVATLIGLLYSGRMTDVEDQIRQLIFVITEDLNEHLNDEESLVFPALEQMIDEQTKQLVLSRYQVMSQDDFDEFDRSPLLSLPQDEPDSGLSDAITNM